MKDIMQMQVCNATNQSKASFQVTATFLVLQYGVVTNNTTPQMPPFMRSASINQSPAVRCRPTVW